MPSNKVSTDSSSYYRVVVRPSLTCIVATGIGVIVPDEYVNSHQEFLNFTPPPLATTTITTTAAVATTLITIHDNKSQLHKPNYQFPKSNYRGLALDLEAFMEARDCYGYTALHYCIKDPGIKDTIVIGLNSPRLMRNVVLQRCGVASQF